MAIGTIVSDAEVRDYLQVDTIDRKTELLIKTAEAYWFADLDRAFVQADYVTDHDVEHNQKTLLLEDRPVTTFTKLEYVSSRDSDGTPTFTEYDGDEYVVDTDAGIVKKMSGSFPEGREEVRSTYTAGFTAQEIEDTSEDDVAMLKLLILAYVARQFMLISSGPKMHMRTASAPEGGSTSYQFAPTEFELRIRNMISRGAVT